MFIIANALPFNGGSTFIIRLCREFNKRGKRIGVLIIMNKINIDLMKQLKEIADVYFLKDFIKFPFKWSANSQLGIFTLIDIKKINILVSTYGSHIHVMGLFGLLFATRLLRITTNPIKITAGIYQQNEFMFISRSFLATYSQELFKRLGADSIIFFNEATKKSHSNFFNLDYSLSTLIPVGIELPTSKKNLGNYDSFKIVSIGNLNKFKTYNLHIVNLMPKLLNINPNFRYEIYGEGELDIEIKLIIKKLSLENRVYLKGSIPYKDFPKVLQDAFLFVGSGTAIVEAAALGIPSLVGIELTKEPITYGFLSDIHGFSYNEYDNSRMLYPMLDIINQIAVSNVEWKNISEKCLNKSRDFSVVYTADGFEDIEKKNDFLPRDTFNTFNLYKLLSSFVCLGILQFLNIDRSFANRRNNEK